MYAIQLLVKPICPETPGNGNTSDGTWILPLRSGSTCRGLSKCMLGETRPVSIANTA